MTRLDQKYHIPEDFDQMFIKLSISQHLQQVSLMIRRADAKTPMKTQCIMGAQQPTKVEIYWIDKECSTTST